MFIPPDQDEDSEEEGDSEEPPPYKAPDCNRGGKISAKLN